MVVSVMEIADTAGEIVVDSRIQSGSEICESVVGVEGSWSRGSNEWTKTAES